MAKLKGIKSIDRQFNRWLRKYGFTARMRGVATDFYWYWTDNTISYSFFFAEKSQKNWVELFKELGCKYNIDTFYTSFLHELGHSRTYYNFTEEELDEYHETVQTMFDEDDMEYEYTHLPVEYEATRWAVEYINKYPERIEELVRKVGKAVRRFYKINKVVNAEMFA